MKGLLYKDLCVMRKQLWSMLVLVAVFCLIPNDSFFNLSLFFVIYTGLLPMSLLSYDERSHWDRLALMLPVTAREVVRSKYVMGFFLTIGAGLLYFAGRTVIMGVAPQEAAGMVLLAVSMGLFFQAVLYPFLFRLGVEKGRLVMGALTAAAVFLCLQTGLAAPHPPVGGEVLTAENTPLLFALAVVADLISIRISERQFLRRTG